MAKVHLDRMPVRLRSEFPNDVCRHLGQVDTAHLELELTRLQARRIQQVVDQLVQAIALFFYNLEAFTYDLLVPVCVLSRKCAGITLDQSDGRLEFVRDHRDERRFHLFRFSKVRDVSYVCDNVDQLPFSVQQG